MSDLYMQMLHANDGKIPEEATIADLQKMKDLETFEWKEYERQQEKNRLQFNHSQNPGEIAKVEQVSKKFSPYYGEAREEKNSKQ